MLQQTQVSTVIPYFHAFVERFPDLEDLASASEDEVLALWSGLGYYSRAKNLHRAARQALDKWGQLPDSEEKLVSLPGIGQSTAAAIVSQAYGKAAAITDGNVRRVLSRYHCLAGHPGQSAHRKALLQLAMEKLPGDEHAADYSQAIMDLGATVCTRSKPACHKCPVQDGCLAFCRDLVNDYPQSKKTGQTPLRTCRMYLCRGENRHILLGKRPPVGVWPGLWSLPETGDKNHLPPDWEAPDQAREISSLKHVFSHFQLEISLYEHHFSGQNMVADDDHWQWMSRERALQTGLPAPIRKFLLSLE